MNLDGTGVENVHYGGSYSIVGLDYHYRLVVSFTCNSLDAYRLKLTIRICIHVVSSPSPFPAQLCMRLNALTLIPDLWDWISIVWDYRSNNYYTLILRKSAYTVGCTEVIVMLNNSEQLGDNICALCVSETQSDSIWFTPSMQRIIVVTT